MYHANINVHRELRHRMGARFHNIPLDRIRRNFNQVRHVPNVANLEIPFFHEDVSSEDEEER